MEVLIRLEQDVEWSFRDIESDVYINSPDGKVVEFKKDDRDVCRLNINTLIKALEKLKED